MKSSIKYFLLALFAVYSGCSTNAPAVADSAIVVVKDKTDRLLVHPDTTGIILLTGLRSDIWQSAEVIVTYISDKGVNQAKAFILERDNSITGNEPLRRAHVRKFIHNVQTALSANSDSIMDHSLVYTSLVRAAGLLNRAQAKHKYLLVYSDLMEHSQSLDCYQRETQGLFQADPERIKRALQKEGPMPGLRGIGIWLLYEPPTYRASGTYMQVARFYRDWFERQGAKVHIEESLNPE